MHISIYSIGKTKHPALAALEDEYCKRIEPLHSLEITYFRTEQKLMQALEDITVPCVALDEGGKEFTSTAFSDWLATQEQLYGACTFVLGDSPGLSVEMKQRCASSIALSKMTFTHEFARVLLLEQLYRGWMIQRNHPYHK